MTGSGNWGHHVARLSFQWSSRIYGPILIRLRAEHGTRVGTFKEISVKIQSARFRKPNPITMSQRDVPGMTRGVVSALTRRGVKALNVGVNFSTPPPGFFLKLKTPDT